MEASEVKHNHPLDTNPEESGQRERKGEREGNSWFLRAEVKARKALLSQTKNLPG